MEYLLLNEKLSLRLGGYIQTPIFSNATTEYKLLDRQEQEDGTLCCEWQKNINRDKTGKELEDLNFGLNGSVSYRLLKKFAIELGVTRELNLFREVEENPLRGFLFLSSQNKKEFQPLKFHFGIEYMFGKKKTD